MQILRCLRNRSEYTHTRKKKFLFPMAREIQKCFFLEGFFFNFQKVHTFSTTEVDSFIFGVMDGGCKESGLAKRILTYTPEFFFVFVFFWEIR